MALKDKLMTLEDFKAVRDVDVASNSAQFTEIKADLDALEPGLSDTAKAALLACFAHVKWDDEHGQSYYDTLAAALNGETYPQIKATFNAGSNIIYTDDSLNTLKQYLTVKYYEDAQSSGTVVNSSNYSLSGNLTEGRSLITATYEELSAAFSISDVVDFYNIWSWSTEFTGAGKITKDLPFLDITKNSVKRGFDHYPVQTKRFGICVNKGKQPAIDHSTQQPTNVYPLPVPKTATKVTVTVTPATDYLFASIARYDAGSDNVGYDYVIQNETASWSYQGTYTCTFTAGENLFLGYNGKKADGSDYTDAERANRVVTVTFE